MPPPAGRIGFLPENPSFYEYLTGQEFLTYCGRLLGVPRGALREQVPALLTEVGLDRAARQQIRKYSKGMVQRLGLAQALLGDPHLLILDEPMSGLDPIGRKEVRDLILRQRAAGRTVFFSTHILPDVEMICDRVGILVGGRLVRSGSMRTLLGEELESIEVTATSIPAETLAAVERLALSPPLVQDDRVMVRLPGEAELEIALFMLVGAKSRVLSVVPQRRSLETIFLEASREAHSVRRILTIAQMAFTETVRDKILYSILVFALAMIGSSTILVTLSVGGEGRIVKNLGLACITLFGLFIAVFIGINLVSREIERRTIFSLLSKPVRRAEFLVGKFLGLGLTLAVNLGIMAAGLMVLAWALEDHWTPRILLAAGFTFVELLVLTATAILFSTFSTPTLSAIYTLLVFVIGRLSADLMAFAAQFGGASLKATAVGLYYLLPNLSRFNLSGAVANDLPLDPGTLALTAIYGAFYAAAVLSIAIAVFQRRDFR